MLTAVAGMEIAVQETGAKKPVSIAKQILKEEPAREAVEEEEEIEITGGEFEDGGCTASALPQKIKSTHLDNHL